MIKAIGNMSDSGKNGSFQRCLSKASYINSYNYKKEPFKNSPINGTKGQSNLHLRRKLGSESTLVY